MYFYFKTEKKEIKSFCLNEEDTQKVLNEAKKRYEKRTSIHFTIDDFYRPVIEDFLSNNKIKPKELDSDTYEYVCFNCLKK